MAATLYDIIVPIKLFKKRAIPITNIQTFTQLLEGVSREDMMMRNPQIL